MNNTKFDSVKSNNDFIENPDETIELKIKKDLNCRNLQKPNMNT